MKAYCVVLCLFVATSFSQHQLAAGQTHRATPDFGKSVLGFEANQGQTDLRVKFLSRGSGYNVFLTDDEAVLTLATSRQSSEKKPMDAKENVMRMRLLGANRHARVSGMETLPGRSNYFIGNDPAKWHTNVVNYAKVRYQNVYDGVDLVYYGNRRQLEYDFVVEPGAKPGQIRLLLKLPTDASGKCARLEDNGDLATSTEEGEVLLRRPYVYQALDDKGTGGRKEIEGRYVVLSTKRSGNACAVRLGFQLARYERTRPVVIDPVLVYSTYLGGSGQDIGTGVAVDASGSAYITGETRSADFPISGGVQSTLSGIGDAFVTKLDPSGSAIVYSTFLGGSFFSHSSGIAVDNGGNAYITGITFDSDFPTTVGSFEAADPTPGTPAAFVTKLNASGSALAYSTYLNGNDGTENTFSQGNAVVVDGSGSAYVAGNTDSHNFPLKNPAQAVLGGGTNVGGDAFLTKLTPDGSAVVYSTYLGGTSDDLALGVAIDTSGNAYIAGRTESTDFPTTTGAFQTAFGGGQLDGFAAKFSPTGALIYSTFLGGSDIDLANAVAADATGNTYVAGFTVSTDFPTTPGSLQRVRRGVVGDSFVSKLNPDGSGLVYSTYLGGSNSTRVGGITLDATGNVYAAGTTDSIDFPTACATQPVPGGGSFDAFASVLNGTGSALLFSTFLGGAGGDEGFGVALDAPTSPNIYVVGETESTNFPTVNAFQSTFQGGAFDAFVAKIKPTSIASTNTSLASSINPAIVGQTIAFTATVTPGCGSVGAPSGTVSFSDGSNILGSGTLASGQASFSTSVLSPGSHSITATYSGDSNFNPSTSAPLTEVIEYNVCVQYDQTRAVHSGATYPIKLELCDVNGNDVSSAGVVVHATQITATSGFTGPVDDSGNANPDNDFRFVGFGYIFNLSTEGLASGTYMLQFTAGSDPLTHTVNFGVK